MLGNRVWAPFTLFINVITVSLLCVLCDGDGGIGECPAYWYYYAGTDCCYYMSTIKLSLLDARAKCHEMGGELAGIADQAEMDFLLEHS